MSLHESQPSRIEDESYRLHLALQANALNVPRGVRPQTVSSNGSIALSDEVDPSRGLLGAYAVYGCDGEALTRPLWGDVDRMLTVFDRTFNKLGQLAYGGDEAELAMQDPDAPPPLQDVPLSQYNLEDEAKKPRMSLVNRLGVSLFG